MSQPETEARLQILATNRVIEGRWGSLCDGQRRLIYLRAARRALPRSQAYFPLLPFPVRALQLCELALVHPGAANPARMTLLEAYRKDGPCMAPPDTLGGLDEYYRRLSAIYANEACMHAISWNLDAFHLSYAKEAAFSLAFGLEGRPAGDAALLEEVRLQRADLEEILDLEPATCPHERS